MSEVDKGFKQGFGQGLGCCCAAIVIPLFFIIAASGSDNKPKPRPEVSREEGNRKEFEQRIVRAKLEEQLNAARDKELKQMNASAPVTTGIELVKDSQTPVRDRTDLKRSVDELLADRPGEIVLRDEVAGIKVGAPWGDVVNLYGAADQFGSTDVSGFFASGWPGLEVGIYDDARAAFVVENGRISQVVLGVDQAAVSPKTQDWTDRASDEKRLGVPYRRGEVKDFAMLNIAIETRPGSVYAYWDSDKYLAVYDTAGNRYHEVKLEKAKFEECYFYDFSSKAKKPAINLRGN